MYFIEMFGKRKAALIIVDRTAESQARSAAANAGVVDQTREDIVGVRGRNAMGPVGRNL